MLSRRTPAAWRKGFALHRRKAGTDRYGDAVAVYDMEHPDVTVVDGDEDGICWQSVRTWQSGGNLSSGGRVDAGGERIGGIQEGVVYGSLEAAVFDRLVIDGSVYELRAIQSWPCHRVFQLQRLR